MPTLAAKYLPRASSVYAFIGSACFLLALTGLGTAATPLAQLALGMDTFGLSVGWLGGVSAWLEAHQSLVSLSGWVLFNVGLLACGGSTALNTGAGPSAVLGAAVLLQAGATSWQVLVAFVLCRTGVELVRSRLPDSTTSWQTTLGALVLAAFAAPLYVVSWLIGEIPRANRNATDSESSLEVSATGHRSQA